MEEDKLTTFKEHQTDERFKRLERRMKMIMLNHILPTNTDSDHNGAWPNLSSINGDSLDTSCAGMSIRSSRIGSVVVSASSNLKKMMMHKKQYLGGGNFMSTSSENQFPVTKDIDSALMPPPSSVPVGSPALRKKSIAQPKREPLLNMSTNRAKNENGFAQSTPVNSIGSFSKCQNSAYSSQGENYFPSKNADSHKSSDDNESLKKPERTFFRWRVMLNDKSLLLIKGTLECGKVVRSKPVIRRLDYMSVQSINTYTYRLHGNLVDENNELPDYVRGKFYNGFPDDWENVYEIWRNYVSGGRRLDFRWPTPITDSDDDIKSEITDIVYAPKLKRSVKKKFGKRKKYLKSFSPDAPSTANNENRLDKSQSNCSKINDASIEISPEHSRKSLIYLSKNPTKLVNESVIVPNTATERLTSLHESSSTSLDSKQTTNKNSLQNAIIENIIKMVIDNLTNKNASVENENVNWNPLQNVITEHTRRKVIDNLTNKNCTMEYVQKVVAMIDSISSVMSDPSLDPNDFNTSGFLRTVKSSFTNTETTNRSINDSSKNVQPIVAAIHSEKQFIDNAGDEPKKMSKIHKIRHLHNARKKLTNEDYNSTDSLTEGENGDRYGKPSRTEDARRKAYESSVSITEDEASNIRTEMKNYRPLKYYSEARNSNLVDTRPNKAVDVNNPRTSNVNLHRCRLNSQLIDSDIHQHSYSEYSQKTFSTGWPMAMNENYKKIYETPASDQAANNPKNKQRVKEYSRVHSEDSDCESLDVMPEKMPKSIHSAVTTELNESASIRHSKDIQSKKKSENNPTNSTEIKGQQVRKKPVVISSENVNTDLRRFIRTSEINESRFDITGDYGTRTRANKLESIKSSNITKNSPADKIISTNIMPEPPKSPKLAAIKSTTKESDKKSVKERSKDSPVKEINLERAKSMSTAEKPIHKFGSVKNPKPLTGWVPAVICDDNADSKCHLVFEGKLLNEAGHILNRKFTTDFVKRRINSKLFETIDSVYYQLVGDFNNTKRVVPKDLVNLCHTGCPIKINDFCEKWKLLSSGKNEISLKSPSCDTSIDCLSIPTSSRGRRILPLLNYWTGERVTMKANKAMYSPGISPETSVILALAKTNEEFAEKKISPKDQASRAKYPAREKQSGPSETTKKDEEKIFTTTSKSPLKKSPRVQKSSRLRSRKKVETTSRNDTSSDSNDEAIQINAVRKKRKMKQKDPALNIETPLKKKMRNSSKNSSSHQSLEQSNSFEKSVETDIKSKLRKRQKINDEAQTAAEESMKSLTERASSNIKCTFYKNIPQHNDDLSEDQLSTT